MQEHAAAVYGIAAPVRKAHAFRMPLDGEQRTAFVGNGLDYAVVGTLDDMESPAWPAYGLVVGTVDGKIRAVEPRQPAIGFCVGAVDLVVGIGLVWGRILQILD